MESRALLLAIAGLAASGSLLGADTPVLERLASLVAPSEKVIAFRKADLNGDGLRDFIFVVERPSSSASAVTCDNGVREVVIALNTRKGKFAVAARNTGLMLCVEDGGVFGDPFYEFEAGPRWFRISHAGGGSSRWYISSTFKYLKSSRSWGLTEKIYTHGVGDQKTYRPKRGEALPDFSTYSTPSPW